jgi:hypothetical protein
MSQTVRGQAHIDQGNRLSRACHGVHDRGEFPELSLMEGGPGDALMKRLRLSGLNSVPLRLEPR